MTATTVVKSIAGAQLYMSAIVPTTFDQAGYEDTDVIASWTEIAQVENFGKHGMTATITEFTPVATSVVTKLKGSKNYGMMAMTLGSVPSDEGQQLLEYAAESNNHYSVKMVYPLGTGETRAAVHYMDVVVGKKENEDGAVNDVSRLSVDLAICRKPVVVAAN